MIFLLYVYFTIAIILDHAHLVSPVALAWSKPQFRSAMLRRWEWYVMLPLVVVALSVIIGLEATSNNRLAPGNGAYWGLTMTYLVWNAWHFGSQHYGVASLLGWRWGTRADRMSLLIWPTMVAMLVPAGGWAALVLIEAISFAHWTIDIGLSTWTMRKLWRIFLPLLLLIGFVGFEWKTITTHPCPAGLPVCAGAWSIPVLVSFRYGLGFIHFLYSRWVWQRGSPICCSDAFLTRQGTI